MRKTDLNSFFSISLLNDSDSSVGDKNQNNDGRFDKCGRNGVLVPFLVELNECKYKGHNSGRKQNEDKLVLELLDNKLKERCRGFLRNFWVS